MCFHQAFSTVKVLLVVHPPPHVLSSIATTLKVLHNFGAVDLSSHQTCVS